MGTIRRMLFPRSDMHLLAFEAADRLTVQARELRYELEDIAGSAKPLDELVQRICRYQEGPWNGGRSHRRHARRSV